MNSFTAPESQTNLTKLISNSKNIEKIPIVSCAKAIIDLFPNNTYFSFCKVSKFLYRTCRLRPLSIQCTHYFKLQFDVISPDQSTIVLV